MHDPLLDHLSRWKPFTALVVGDFMLDQQVYGDAERLSPDAPVPILLVKRQENSPGGAANVCLDLAALRATVLAFGVRGDDPAGAILDAELRARGIDTTGLITDRARPTTVKQNLVGLAQTRHPQKMFRVDFESREPLAPQRVRELLAAFERVVRTADVVCLEDYNKGVCTDEICRGVIRIAREAGKPVFVDPAKISDYFKYRGATTITPNRTEAEFATGHAAPASIAQDEKAAGTHHAVLARDLMDKLDLDAVVLTLDRHGALLLERDAIDPLAVPTVARQVYDVTGAGDMFLAALAAARANSIAWPDAARFANAAAGLEVEVFGVKPIPLEDIHHSIVMAASSTGGKLRTTEQLLVEIAARRRAGQKIVFTNGCFDVIHAGHVHLLDEAKRFGDFLIVATNTDEKVREQKGANRPVNELERRVVVLGGLAAVDAVVVFAEDTPLELIHKVRPDVLVKGDEYNEDTMPGASFIRSYGGRIERIPMMRGSSTTATLRALGDPRAEITVTPEQRERFIRDQKKP
jgi:D-beta-D-heptose 7-phosphate kinase/D-beta-D-heptose 1-phosphate adenosyltransferase